MRRSLGNLHGRSDLRIRSREQAGDLLGHGLIGGETGQLGLPQIEVAPGQFVEFGASSRSRVVVSGGHAPTITHRSGSSRIRCFAGAKPALSHCGIGAKVNGPSKRAFTARGS
jgi:hypothetical protein